MSSQLHEAAVKGDRKALRHLLKMGLSTEDQDQYGCTPLMLAAEDGHGRIVQELLDHAAHIDAGNQYGYTALMLAATKGYTEVIRLLVERGASLESRNWVGQTALNFTALVSGSIDGISTLLDLGADIESTDDCQYTPLISAAERGHLEAVEVLLQRGACLEARTKSGSSALAVKPVRASQVRDMNLSVRLTQIAVLLREAGLTE